MIISSGDKSSILTGFAKPPFQNVKGLPNIFLLKGFSESPDGWHRMREGIVDSGLKTNLFPPSEDFL